MADSALSWLIDSMDISITLIIVVITVTLGYLALGTGNNAPPGPTSWPIVGTFPQIAKVGEDNLHKLYHLLHKKYGSVAQLYFGRYPFVLMSGFDSVHDVFVNQRDAIMARPDFIPGVQTSKHLRTGIPFGNGTPWAEARKTMLSAVSVVLKSSSHEDLVLEEVENLVKEFTEKEGVVFQPGTLLFNASLSWHLQVAVGKRYDQDDAMYQSFLKSFLNIYHNDGSFSPFGTIPLLKYIPFISKSFKAYLAGYDGIDKIAASDLKDRKSLYTESRLESIVDVFIREQRKNPDNTTFTDDNIAVYIGDYLIGGVSSVAYTLDWGLLFMAANPEIQEKCQQEIEEVCDLEDPVKFSDVDKLPYVCATVYETQRMGSVVPISFPYCVLRDITVKDYHIPQGTMVAGHLASVHMDETKWTKPQQFNPGRFLDTDGKLGKKPDGFMPFGNGGRFCPGYSIAEKETIVVFANLLKSFNFTNKWTVNTDGIYTLGVHPVANDVIVEKRN